MGFCMRSDRDSVGMHFLDHCPCEGCHFLGNQIVHRVSLLKLMNNSFNILLRATREQSRHGGQRISMFLKTRKKEIEPIVDLQPMRIDQVGYDEDSSRNTLTLEDRKGISIEIAIAVIEG